MRWQELSASAFRGITQVSLGLAWYLLGYLTLCKGAPPPPILYVRTNKFLRII